MPRQLPPREFTRPDRAAMFGGCYFGAMLGSLIAFLVMVAIVKGV